MLYAVSIDDDTLSLAQNPPWFMNASFSIYVSIYYMGTAFDRASNEVVIWAQAAIEVGQVKFRTSLGLL